MIIAITARYESDKKDAFFSDKYACLQYYRDLFDSLDVLLVPVMSEKNIDTVCRICDGLVLTGTPNDAHPHYYGHEPIPSKKYEIDEYALDQKLLRAFSLASKPILGICGGIQSINVFFGGTLHQYIEDHGLNGKMHRIEIAENSILSEIYHCRNMEVNSFHHQAVWDVAPGFSVTARAEDGTIEAIEKENIFGVQWHPEQMMDRAIFEKFKFMCAK